MCHWCRLFKLQEDQTAECHHAFSQATNGPDKNGFSLGFSRNVAEVFGDQGKYWLFPVFSSLGDGHSFVTRLVHIDPEQANSVLQQNGKSLADGEANPCELGNSIQHTTEDSKDKTEGGQTVSVTVESEP